ncbi:MAG: response regulator, partial [Verrucomicrobiota bacterium]
MNKRISILLIDKNPNDGILIERELSRKFPDSEVRQVWEQEDYVQAAEDGVFDLVVIDYNLDWTDGLALLRNVKARWPHCPAILFTSHGSEAIAAEAMKAGLHDFVIKSGESFSELVATIWTMLESSWQRQTLEEVESRYRALWEGLPIGLFKTTSQGQFIEVNPAFVQTLGYPTRESLLQINLAALCVKTEDNQGWKSFFEGSRSGGRELPLRHYAGQVIWARITGGAIRDNTGRICQYQGSLEDLTEQRHVEVAGEKQYLGILLTPPHTTGCYWEF